ncbi:hypothetical protein [Streptomyces sp. DH8]|uniref:hypothetical protein n=1 Tax=Streptomyces sp. DH8 TaxID=2857008 RepID=UPI001E425905|nr:hypothetical protein [Streptomyces sp. DH8]
MKYATSGELPTGHRVVVIQTITGPLMVVREGKITPDLVEEIVEMYDALKATGILEDDQKE